MVLISWWYSSIFLLINLEDINLAEIAAKDNYPPEIVAVPVEEDVEKSVSQAGSKKL